MKTILSISSEQRAKLAQLAEQQHVSIAEINRRAIDAYNPNTPSIEIVDQLAEMVLKTNYIAMQALEEAHNTVKETLFYLGQKRRNS